MDSMNSNRQPRGVTTGGQFATKTHAEAEGVTLVDEERPVADADAARSARWVSVVGERLGLEFEMDGDSEFDDWKAPIGNGRSVVVSPQDPTLIAFVAADGTYHDAVVPDLEGDTHWLRFDDPDQSDRWVDQVRRAVNSARSGASLPDLVDSMADR